MASSILFVCTGNICRSPTAEGVFRKRFKDAGFSHVNFDSAGTHGYHVGEQPDPRSIKAAAKREVDISRLVARKFIAADFEKFDLILALDAGHLHHMHAMANAEQKQRTHLLLPFAGHPSITDVPDPYYGNAAGFEHVLDLLEWAADAMIRGHETNPALNRQ